MTSQTSFPFYSLLKRKKKREREREREVMRLYAFESAAFSSENHSMNGSVNSVIDDMFNLLELAVRGLLATMREEQWPYMGSLCSKRLQDRIQRSFPVEYKTVVDGIYERSWESYLTENAGVFCFTQKRDAKRPSIEWMIGLGAMRCYFLSEDIERVHDSDEMLGRFVRDHCRKGLEKICRTILMELFSAIIGTEPEEDEGEDDTMSSIAEYELGSLVLWKPVLRKLWLHPIKGRKLPLRDLERPCQQLGFHIRLRCRWATYIGNNLILKYIHICVLRVLLNVVGPPLQPSKRNQREYTEGTLLVGFSESLGKYIVSLEETDMWGRIPPIPGNSLRRGLVRP
ncbi:hypothetical protein MOQ_006175 [Trypanosoma cruzi marinkellei]|uniref:Uncharacterized protein n=1 Tax=Trypanosoma cruzi marinkellei TaxID=85056 RepID=K2NME7_TRYCR|nr:hypothetical protein MOQ_006175 [Trypanosoma cruzi marinkellei]